MKAIVLCRWSLRNALTSKKSLFVLGLMAIFTNVLIAPLITIASYFNLRLTPMTYPLLINDMTAHLMILSGYIFLLATIDQNNICLQPIIPRGGYRASSLGQLLFLIILALIYQLMMTVLSQLWLIGLTDWHIAWGDGWIFLSDPRRTISFFKVFLPNGFLMSTYTPIETIWKTYLSEWALLIILGMISTSLNRLSRTALGSFASMGIALTDILFYGMFPISFRRLSPVSLAMLSTFQELECLNGITQEYAFTFFPVALIVLGAAYMYVNMIWIRKRKKGCLL